MSGLTFVIVIFVGALLMSGCPAASEFKRAYRKQSNANLAKGKLASKKFVVVIRAKDGKRNYWETVFIDQMMHLSAQVLYFSQECGNDLWSGLLGEIPEDTVAFVGTTWECGGGWRLDGKFLAKKSGETTPNQKPILAPLFSEHYDAASLRDNLVECINRFF